MLHYGNYCPYTQPILLTSLPHRCICCCRCPLRPLSSVATVRGPRQPIVPWMLEQLSFTAKLRDRTAAHIRLFFPLLVGVLLGLFSSTTWQLSTERVTVYAVAGQQLRLCSEEMSSPTADAMQYTRPGWLPGHIQYDLSRSRVEVHRALALRYLEPYIGPLGHRPIITTRMLDVAEALYNRSAFRIRVFDGRLYFRHLLWFQVGYFYERMNWLLRTLQDMLREGMLPVSLDLLINVSSGPSAAVDTSLGDDAGFPLFSLRTSTLHSDIPLPHPMTYGAHGNYTWSAEARSLPWSQRTARAGFFGKATCFPMQADNWHVCPRVRAAQLAQRYPELMDVGLTKWHLAERRAVLYPMSRIPEIEASTNLSTTEPRSWEQQASYRYVIDIDGDLGSSRKPGILTSGSLLLTQRSSSYNYFEPLMLPGRDFLLYEQWFDTLPNIVRWAQQHDEAAHDMQQSGQHFADEYLSFDAAKEYISILLIEYSRLLHEPPSALPVPSRQCDEQLLDSLTGCDWSWILYNGTDVVRPPHKQRRKVLAQRLKVWRAQQQRTRARTQIEAQTSRARPTKRRNVTDHNRTTAVERRE